MKPLNRFAVVRRDGQAETEKDGATFWDVLARIHQEFGSAGGDWNRPVMLLHNGKVVIEKGLADIAWSYGRALYAAQQAAVEQVRANYTPDWLPQAPHP